MEDLHYDPEKTIRTTELAIGKAKEKIELLEESFNIKSGIKSKNEDGVYEISEKTKKELEEIKELIEWNKNFITTQEENIKIYMKDLEKIKKEP